MPASALANWIVSVPPSIARAYQDLYAACIEGKLEPQNSDLVKIERDIHRTFPVFGTCPAGYEDASSESEESEICQGLTDCVEDSNCALLRRLLHAVCCYAPYVQGMNYIAAKLLLHSSSDVLTVNDRLETSFVLFMFLYKECGVSGVFTGHGGSLRQNIAIFEHHIRRHLNDLWHYFQHVEFACTSFAMEWLVTLFITTHPQSVSSYAVSQLLAGDRAAVYRIGVAALKHHEKTLLRKSLDELQIGFRALMRTSQAPEVIRLAQLLVMDCDTNVRYIVHRKTSADRDALTPHARCTVM